MMIYVKVASRQAIGRPNTLSKLCMSGAVTLNVVYIFPLSGAFGYDTIIAKPFCLVRDLFYKTGLASLPGNDAEREMLWYIVRYAEFEQLIAPQIDRYIEGKSTKNPKQLVLWTDEIYEHIHELPKKSFRDPWFTARRYNIFCDVVWSYIAFRPSLVSELAGENKNIHPFLKDPKEIARIEEILRIFSTFREQIKTREPEGLKYFNSLPERWYGDLNVIYMATLYILVHRDITGTLSCDDPVVKLYLQTRNSLLYDVANDVRLTSEKQQEIKDDLSASLDNGLEKAIALKCPQLMKKPDQPIDMRQWRQSDQ
ncbi:hypothetical protein ANRL1_03424 [Anaerolineae bacterium]|nr:hypothetical protein ANRL1_03424 [Anaerolineae bacterium]